MHIAKNGITQKMKQRQPGRQQRKKEGFIWQLLPAIQEIRLKFRQNPGLGLFIHAYNSEWVNYLIAATCSNKLFRCHLRGTRHAPASPKTVPKPIKQKEAVISEISRAQPAGFGAKSEKPGQSQPLHP